MKKRLVIALGGNALGETPEEQLVKVRKVAKIIVNLTDDGYDIVVTHGNGPQVGIINVAMESGHENENTPNMPFAECGAMSQGYIGYHLQQALQQELNNKNKRRQCVTILTQVLVDSKDKAFKNPTKPIGSFYSKEEADEIVKEKGYVFKEDAGRGYRRVVPSPHPLKIIELKIIQKLLGSHSIVIAAGGGGIPVVKKRGVLTGVDAVIDKDKTSARLAIDLRADMFLILTTVDKVKINFGKENETDLDMISVKDAKKYLADGEFKEGSMKPKVEACLEYLSHKRGGQAVITSLDKAEAALDGKTGTVIVKGGV